MATIVPRSKALSVSPLKSAQSTGASLAFLGIHRAIPMLHGSQGCTAFDKIFLVRHFREPIPLQTTAMDHLSCIMGANDNIIEGLKTICEKAEPDLVGLPTTGLSETQGADIQEAIRHFRERYPVHNGVRIVPVHTPDFDGCLESGFAAAVCAMIDELTPEAAEAGTRPGRQPHQVNVLTGSHLTPGDVESLKEIIGAFGLHPVVIPDLSDSLDGHLAEPDFSPVTTGGRLVSDFATLGNAAASLIVGRSLTGAADKLRQRTGVPDYRFDHLMGLEAVDSLLLALHRISDKAVPKALERQRAQLQDAMLDTHFVLGQARVAMAADPDLLHAFGQLLQGMGAEVVAAVAPNRAPVLEDMSVNEVRIGDLEELERIAGERGAEILIGNSHAVASAERLGIPLLHAGFPQYDLIGGYQRTRIGYRGTRRTLFDLGNILLHSTHHGIRPYRSVYAQTGRNPDGSGAMFESGLQ